MQARTDARRIYVGMHDGVCAVSTDDGGKTWKQSPVHSLEHAAARLSACSSEPNNAYLAAYESCLFRTTNGGDTWQRLDSYPSIYAHSVVVDPQNPRLVYAGSEPASIYRSRDGGDSWEECAGFRAVPESSDWGFHAPTRDSHVRDLRMSPDNPRQMFAGVEVGGIIRSDDGGDTWQQLQGTNDDVHCLDMSPDRPPQRVRSDRPGSLSQRRQRRHLDPHQQGLGAHLHPPHRCGPPTTLTLSWSPSRPTPGVTSPSFTGRPTAATPGCRSRTSGPATSLRTW